MIRRQDVLFYAGGDCLRRFGVPVWGMTPRQRSALSSTRTGDVATSIGRDGIVRLVSANRLRFVWLDLDGDGERETLALLAEPARTNAVSAAITSWAITNSGTWTGTTAGPDGVAGSGKGLAHGSGGSNFRASNIPTGTPTNNAVQSFGLFAKAADVSWCFIQINRKDAALRNVYFNLATGVVGTADSGITGYIDGPYLNGFYRCMATCDVVSGGSTAQMLIGPADGDGDQTMAGAGAPYVYFFAPSWEMNARLPSSPLLTAGAARGAELISFPIGGVWGPMSVLVKSYELGTVGETSGFLWRAGVAGAGVSASIASTGGTYFGHRASGGGTVASTLAAVPARLTVVEHLLTLAADGTPTISQSVNGAAPTTGTGGSALDFVSGRLPSCYLGTQDPNTNLNPIISVLGVRGVRTLDEMRGLFAA